MPLPSWSSSNQQGTAPLALPLLLIYYMSIFHSRPVVREDTFIHRLTVSKVPNPAAENSPENSMREPAPAYNADHPAVSNTWLKQPGKSTGHCPTDMRVLRTSMGVSMPLASAPETAPAANNRHEPTASSSPPFDVYKAYFNSSYTTKRSAAEGMLRNSVAWYPRYSPRKPCCAMQC